MIQDWKLAFRISRRYFFSSHLPRALNLISGITVSGVAIGTALLVLVLSVFNGFYFLIRDHYEAFDADLKISPASGIFLPENPVWLKDLGQMNEVLAFSGVTEGQAIARYGGQQQIITLKGVGPDFKKISDVSTLMQNGSFSLKAEDGSPTLVLGAGIGWNLGINLADWTTPVEVFTLSDQIDLASADPEKMIKRKYIMPVGFFSIEKDYDQKFVLCDRTVAQELFEAPNRLTSIEVKLKHPEAIEKVKGILKSKLGASYRIESWFEQHATLNAVLQNEKAVGFLIIFFMLLLISFNIVGSLAMIVISKQKEIAIFRTLGASRQLVKRTFLFLGLQLGGLGAIAGLILGISLSWAQETWGILRFDVSDTEMLMIDHFPITLMAQDLVWIGITVFLLTLVSAWLPARRAAGSRIVVLFRGR